MNALGGPNTVPAAGADIFPTAACLRWERWGIAVRSCSCNRYAVELIAGDEDIAQIVFEHKSQQLIVWLSDGPAVFFVMAYSQTVALGNLLEAFVVVGISSARVLDAVDVAVVMHHLVKQRCADVFNGSCERTGPDIDFVAAASDGYPSIVSHREVTICSRCRLDSNGGSCKCIFKKSLIEQVKQLVEISCNAII